jgi:hypothetical protein
MKNNDRFISGYPFHAKFKHDDPNENAIIYHKAHMPRLAKLNDLQDLTERSEENTTTMLGERPSNFTNSVANNTL